MMSIKPDTFFAAIESDKGAGDRARDRLTWIIELMSRYATEKSDSHDSARLAAAIVAHLKSLSSELPSRGQLSETVSHWLDAWEPILERHIATQRPSTAASVSLTQLVMRARYA